MTIAIWKDEFGWPDKEGWGLGSEGASQTPTDEGLPRTRLRQSLNGQPTRWQTVVTANGKAAWERWWRESVSYGALPFLMRDPTRHGWPMLTPAGEPVLTPDGRPILLSCWRLMMFVRPLPELRVWGKSNKYLLPVSAIIMP